MAIEPLIHRCTVPNGDMKGNKHSCKVTPFEVDFKTVCEVCGERLATTEQIVAYIYEELLR